MDLPRFDPQRTQVTRSASRSHKDGDMWQKSNTSAALMRSVKRTDIQNPLTRARSDVHIGAASVALSDFADRCRVLVACTTQRCLEPLVRR